jgi:hypothetical protein
MPFISNGDFVLPFDYLAFLFKHLFLWSENSTALSLDGILRIYSKSETLLFFFFTQNSLLTSYFYILFIVTFCGLSGYLFFRRFLSLGTSAALVGTLLFVINPAFLGNYAKIGLVFSVSALPLALVALKAFFETRNISRLLAVLLLLNISLLHPFTFLVNLAVLAGYGIVRFIKQPSNELFKKTLLGGFLFVMFSLYFILPILSLGTISKDAIQNEFTRGAEEVDYTLLVDVANTDGYINGLILAKNVFLDFSFYPEGFATIFYIGSYLLLSLLLLLICTRKTDPNKDRLIALFGLGYLLTVALAAIGSEFVSNLVKWGIETFPAGWSFRSPLKWQLYTPLCLAALFALSLEQTRFSKRVAVATIVTLTLAINGYLLYDISNKLLTPKQLGEYSAMYSELQDASLVLSVKNQDCVKTVPGETLSIVNQVTSSISAGVFSINEKQLSSVPVNSFDYILACKHISPAGTYWNQVVATEHFTLYKNQLSGSDISAFETLYALTSPMNYERKQDFVANNFEPGRMYFTYQKDHDLPTVQLHNYFENVTVDSVKKNTLQVNQPHFSKGVLVRPEPIAPATSTTSTTVAKTVQVVTHSNFLNELTYTYPTKLDLANKIENGTFAKGLWSAKVGDCFAYDDNPILRMERTHVNDERGYVLELSATRHIACTDTVAPVLPETYYLFSFDYLTTGERNVAFYINYLDESGRGLEANVSNRLLGTEPGIWQQHTQIIRTPAESTQLRLYLYTHQDDGVREITNLFDNVSLIPLPADIYDHWAYETDVPKLEVPREITFDLLNPTKKLVHIKGATTPFYLAMSESYHPQWQAQFTNNKIQGFFKGWVPFVTPDRIADDHHFELNGFLNGWYIDIDEHCKQKNLCTQNPDGSYDIELTLEFFPQRWFYLGLLISCATLVGCITYLVSDFIRRRRTIHDTIVDPRQKS